MATAFERVEGALPRALYRSARRVENISLKLLDVGIIGAAWVCAYLAAAAARHPFDLDPDALWLLAVAVLVQGSVNRLAGLYGPVWEYASIDEGVRVVAAVGAGTVAASVALLIGEVVTDVDLPMLTMAPVAALLVLLGCGGTRFQARLFALERMQGKLAEQPQAVIVGAGPAGAALSFELAHAGAAADAHIVGFVDDDPDLRGRSVRGIPILGTTDEIEAICRDERIERVFIALPDATKDERKIVIDRVLRTSALVKVVASTSERVGRPMLRTLRDLDVADLLGREHAPVDSAEIAEYLCGATVLVTGAGGSIGSEIARQVARYGPGRLLLVDRDETLLHDVRIGPLADADAILLDVRDRARVRQVFDRYRPDVVFHAAANKHVPLLERNRIEAIRTNVIGTWTLARAAAESGCRRFVHISTDKAASPCSVMGATKRAAEQVVFEVGRRHQLPFVAVRFGNVLGSRGSVVPTFLRQILDGGPVTVTAPEMTRYFMTIPEAVSLVLQSGAMAEQGRTFLLDMGEPVSILGLARQMIRLAGLRPDQDIAVDFVGARPGERLHEQLHDDAERVEPSAHPSIFGLSPAVTWNWDDLRFFLGELEQRCDDGQVADATATLEEMLHRGGVECRLDPLDGGDEDDDLLPPAEPDTVIDLTEPTRRRVIDLVDTGSRAAADRRPAVLGGPVAFHPPLPFARPARPPLEQVVARLRSSYDVGSLTNGALVRDLEERLAARLGVANVVAVSSCTAGLMLAVQAVTEGDTRPVALPSFTFSASAHAVAWNGRTPRFVECDRATFQVDTTSLEAALDGASAVLATHVFGAPCDPIAVEKLARSAGLPVVFDAAHALGATCDGRPIGGFGDVEVFSLTPTKVLVAGEGGIVATDDECLAQRIRIGRDYGNPGNYDTQFVGLNARMSEFHAAMALASLATLDVTLDRRRALASRYHRGLDAVAGIHFQAIPLSDRSTFKDLTIAVDVDAFGLTRDQLVEILAVDGIDTRNYFDPPVHRQRAYRDAVKVDLPVTDRTSAGVVSLPLYPDLSDGDVDRVIDVIAGAHAHADEINARWSAVSAVRSS